MPTIVALLSLVLVFGAGVRLIAVPVSPGRLEAFTAAHSLKLDDAGRMRLLGYLSARRRARVAGVLIAATIALTASIPQQRIDIPLLPLLFGWLAGAVAVELLQRGRRVRRSVPVPVWWGRVLAATALIAVLWTAAATLSRSEGVPAGTLLAWGCGALVTAVLVRATLRYVGRNSLRDNNDPGDAVDAAAAADSARGLTIGGVAAALLCLARMWMEAVPGPYDEPSEAGGVVWLAAIFVVAAVVAALGDEPASSEGKLRWRPGFAVGFVVAFVVAAALPLAWAVPVRLAQRPPLSVQDAGVGARIRVARLDMVRAVQAELGLKPDPPAGNVGDAEKLPSEVIGRVDFARPAPRGARYQLFAFDRRDHSAVAVYGFDGSAWHGRWSAVLPARYPWLSNVIGVRDARGFSTDPMAVSAEPKSGLLWFRAPIADGRSVSAADVQLVLMLVRDGDEYIYWATTVPTTAG